MQWFIIIKDTNGIFTISHALMYIFQAMESFSLFVSFSLPSTQDKKLWASKESKKTCKLSKVKLEMVITFSSHLTLPLYLCQRIKQIIKNYNFVEVI